MRLSGVAFRAPMMRSEFVPQSPESVSDSHIAPLSHGYLPLDKFSGILGRNDSGKTRLLSVLETALDPPSNRDLVLPTSILFFSCSREEFEVLTRHATLDLVEFEEEALTLEEEPEHVDRRVIWDGRPSLDPVVFEGASISASEPAVSQYAELLKTAWTRDSQAFDRLVREAITPSGEDESLTVALHGRSQRWNVFWCVPPAADCSEATRSDLETCLLGPGYGYTDVLEQEEGPVIMRDSATWGWDSAAPIPVAPVGSVPLPLVPRSLRAADLSTVLLRLEEVFAEFAIHTTRLEALLNYDITVLDDEGHVPGYGRGQARTSKALSDVWLKQTPVGGYEVNRDMLIQAKQVEVIANELLPPFISRDYRIRLTISPPTLWGDGSRLKLELVRERGEPSKKMVIDLGGADHEIKLVPNDPEFSPGHSFPAEKVAEGFKLWIGMSLAEASRILEVIPEQLEHYIEDLVDNLGGAYGEEAEEKSRSEGQLALDRARSIADSLNEATGGEPLHRALNEFLGPDRLTPWVRARAEMHRGLIYLLDEPERHLHPALQRDAASWLGERLGSSGFQAVVATHSLPFMAFSGDASFTYLVREPEAPTALVPIDPRELDSLSVAATELGIDRGELLSLVNLFLWVEGYSEQVILETLFGQELREMGVQVIPLHGHPGARGILDTRIHSFTSARVAVWLDAISPDFIAEAVINPEVEIDGPEEKTLLEVIRSARSGGQELIAIGVENPGDDVFDLLDDLAIQSEFPDYPGHAEAGRLWAKAVERGAKIGERKRFWARTFRTPITPDSCRKIALRMRQEGRVTPQLQSVISQCREIFK